VAGNRKVHLAAIKMLFDWLVTGQVIAVNPAHSVRGPRHSVKKGKTSVLSAEEMGALSHVFKFANRYGRVLALPSSTHPAIRNPHRTRNSAPGCGEAAGSVYDLQFGKLEEWLEGSARSLN